MNAKQKLQQIKLQQWAEHFRDQTSIELVAKAWRTKNSITIRTYNYWKHRLKQEYLDSALSDDHEIIPLAMNHPLTTMPVNPQAHLPIARFARFK